VRGRPLSIRVFSTLVALGLGLTFAGAGASAAPNITAVPSVTTASVATKVAVIAPLTVPSGSDGLISAEALADYTGPAGLLTRQLDAVAGKAITVALDPMIVASIRVLGSSAPDSARRWLERLSLISNEVIPLPYGNSDLTLATQAGQESALTPISFDFALNAENFAKATEPRPQATASAAPGDSATDAVPPYPTTKELLSWVYAIDGFVLPRANSVVSSDMETFANSGFSTVLLASTNVSRVVGAGPVATIDGMKVLITDSAASLAMDEALGSTLDHDVPSAENALSTAVLAAGASQSADTGSVLIMIDHSLELSAARLDIALASLSASPSITLVALTALASATPFAATMVDMPQAEERVADVERLFTAAQLERTFFSIAADPEALIAQRQLALIDVLATNPTDDPAEWMTRVDEFLAESGSLRTAVKVVEASNFLLLADNSFLPVSVSNDLNQAVTVYITVDPRTALLAVGNNRVELQIPANSQAKGNVPVESLSNGVVKVEINLASNIGLPIGGSTVTEINVQAGWETPIVLAFGALVVVIFGVGFVRSIVRRRKPVDD
jgi:hypothetical protein